MKSTAHEDVEGKVTIIESESDEIVLQINMPEVSKTGVIFQGKLLSIEGHGHYDDRIVMGDFGSNSDYSIAFFKVEKEISQSHLLVQKHLAGMSVLTIVIENIVTGELYVCENPVSIQQVERLLKAAKTNYYESDISKNGEYTYYHERVIQLYQIEKNLKAIKNVSNIKAGGSLSIQSGVTYGGHQAATYSQISNMLDTVNNNGVVNLSSNSVMRAVVSQTGWKRYNKLSEKYMYVMYGAQQTGGTNMVQMSLIKWSGSTGTEISSQVSVINGAIFEYDPITKKATLLYYGWGINLRNCYVGVGHLAGDHTFFKTTYTTFTLYNGDPFSKMLWSKISPTASLTYDIYNALTNSTTQSFWGVSFQQTYDDQMQAYHNKLVKDIGTHSGSNYLCSPGNYLHVEASYGGTYSSSKAVFKFTCTNNL